MNNLTLHTVAICIICIFKKTRRHDTSTESKEITFQELSNESDEVLSKYLSDNSEIDE